MPRKRFTLKSAVHIFLIREQHILLLKRFNTGYEDGNYSVIAGHLDGGEEVKTAAIREAREEARIHLLHRDLAIVGVMHRKATDERIDFFATAATWSGDIINAEPHKCSELAWFVLNHLPENTIPYIRRAIENYQRGIWFDSFGWS
jgi:ADP-ribose pyrophosphatase YjhB (NUDIX family)